MIVLRAMVVGGITRYCIEDCVVEDDTNPELFSLESPVIESLPDLPNMKPPNTDCTCGKLLGYVKIIKVCRAWMLYYQRDGFIFSYADEITLTDGRKGKFLLSRSGNFLEFIFFTLWDQIMW